MSYFERTRAAKSSKHEKLHKFTTFPFRTSEYVFKKSNQELSVNLVLQIICYFMVNTLCINFDTLS